MRILYVEDNQANVYLVRRVARNHTVINYIDGEEALRNFVKDDPDLVLMDIQLAGRLTGIEVVKKLRSEGHTVPIIAVTAYAMVGDRERCIAAGCDDYMAKPLPIPELVTLFQTHDPAGQAAKSAKAPTLTKPVTQKIEIPASKDKDTADAPEAIKEVAEKPVIVAEATKADASVTADETAKPATNAVEAKPSVVVADEGKEAPTQEIVTEDKVDVKTDVQAEAKSDSDTKDDVKAEKKGDTAPLKQESVTVSDEAKVSSESAKDVTSSSEGHNIKA